MIAVAQRRQRGGSSTRSSSAAAPHHVEAAAGCLAVDRLVARVANERRRGVARGAQRCVGDGVDRDGVRDPHQPINVLQWRGGRTRRAVIPDYTARVPTDGETWKELATRAPDRDPHLTVRARDHAELGLAATSAAASAKSRCGRTRHRCRRGRSTAHPCVGRRGAARVARVDRVRGPRRARRGRHGARAARAPAIAGPRRRDQGRQARDRGDRHARRALRGGARHRRARAPRHRPRAPRSAATRRAGPCSS